ncbi:hypothetical protein NDU88_009258 [Pleurodeles waltl]|uniref:Myb-like domain-containing protein n=1 Tax=Pleurodeles waltl TaxID=8319 RepID=A0AAV7PUP9_PLEWA|nr:hypothetical protein NDU88_009258 [Pleurodeles waltl]
MPRGKIWLQEEIKSLLNGVQKSGNLDILMSSRHAKVIVWGPIAQHLVRDGYQRTWKQCRAKWKVLRRAFHLEHEYRLLYGTHSSKRTPRYRIMLRMWQQAGRPVFREQHEKSPSLQHSQSEDEVMKAFMLPHSSQVPRTGYRGLLNGSSGDVLQQNLQLEDEEVRSFIMPRSSRSPRTGYRNMHNGSSAQLRIPSWIPEEEEDLQEQDTMVKEERLWSHPPLPTKAAERLPAALSSNPLWPQTPLPAQESEREPSTAPPQQTEMIRLLSTIQMQQQEIINRLDYLNHNVVQAALLSDRQTTAASSQGSESKSPLFYIPSSLPTGHLSQMAKPTTYIPAPQSRASSSMLMPRSRPIPTSSYSFTARPAERSRHST